ncbi:hypothetical protein BN1723_010276, partial [Verticillium longisporum]|uniref:Large ribosomal subunit protein bL21m n=3 Tax=Verticillium TaxID=1036719 RepID=G2WZ43_VERDV
MSRALLRSALELRAPLTRLPPTFLLPIRARAFNTTTPIIEPTQDAIPSQAATTIAQQAAKADPLALYPKQAPATQPAPITDSVRQLLPLLAAQPSHYITFHIHGRPYLVQPGDAIRLPFRMPGVVPGDVLRLDCASVIGSRDFTLKGSPYIDERLFECRAVVTGSELEPVRIKIKKKQRTRRAQRVRSQHRFTTLAVSELRIKGLEEIEG